MSQQHATNTPPLAAALEKLLSSTYAFYLAAHHHHWNVEGPQFTALHEMFEQQYRDAFDALDEIAERIRMLGVPVHNMHADVTSDFGVIGEDASARARQMIQQLVTLARSAIASAKQAIHAAEQEDDAVSEDLCIGRIATHEKQIWMLSSLLK